MKISVIICCYNGEEFIKDAILSVLNQTYSNFEIIIIDDNSIDNTKIILEKFSKNKSINIYYNKKNYGLGYSRNIAVKYSTGNWITFLDQDDLYNKNRLLKISNLAKNNNKFKFFFHDTNYINRYGKIVGSHLNKYSLPYPIIKKNKSTTLLLKYGSYIDSEGLLFHKDIFYIVGKFDEKFTYLCDYEFFLRISFKFDLYYTLDKLSSWRIHDNQQQKKNNNQKIERLQLFFKYFLDTRTNFYAKFLCFRTIIVNLISIIKDIFK